MRISELNECDLEDLAELYRQFWGDDSSLEKMRTAFRKYSKNESYIFLGAKQDGRLIGTVMGIVCGELYGQCKPFMVIEDVIVDRDHRRKGVGSSLMQELESCAVDIGCAYIIFVTEKERTGAHQFYQSLGYASDAYKGFKKRIGTDTKFI